MDSALAFFKQYRHFPDASSNCRIEQKYVLHLIPQLVILTEITIDRFTDKTLQNNKKRGRRRDRRKGEYD